MLMEALRSTGIGVGQCLILGLIGFILVRRAILAVDGLQALSRLVVDVTLPLLIFSRLVRDFNPQLYPHWWFFPLLSVAITGLGFLVGWLFTAWIKGEQNKLQFISLVTFQNAGYLPLVMVAAMLPQAKADVMFIYLFLFMLSFNLLVFSFGVYLLTFHRNRKFDWATVFSPPVIATLAGLAVAFLGAQRFIPQVVLRPLDMIGECTLPLAMIVVGGNIASIRCGNPNKRIVSLLVLAKLLLLPILGLGFLYLVRLPELVGFLIVLELAMPSAANLSVIMRRYELEDCLISQGLFYTYISCLFTIPLFLSLYFMISMVK
ncbi:MAG TPA: AEC family transporter [Candidatus Omnitrophota bacterium]|nr:AEC family transporter [Candidatus Omnitrophota bacterium]